VEYARARHPAHGEEFVGELRKTSWSMLEVEKMNDKITRQMVWGENAMLARILLKQGAVVPRHHHLAEQFTWILSGALRFTFDDNRELVVGAGEVLFIPANMPHAAVAVEDTVDIDIFSPRREDWIKKDDAYLRG